MKSWWNNCREDYNFDDEMVSGLLSLAFGFWLLLFFLGEGVTRRALQQGQSINFQRRVWRPVPSTQAYPGVPRYPSIVPSLVCHCP